MRRDLAVRLERCAIFRVASSTAKVAALIFDGLLGSSLSSSVRFSARSLARRILAGSLSAEISATLRKEDSSADDELEEVEALFGGGVVLHLGVLGTDTR